MTEPQTDVATDRGRFHQILANTFIANLTASFLWFALTFWVYLETRSVFLTAIIGGSFMAGVSVMGIPFGSWPRRTVWSAWSAVWGSPSPRSSRASPSGSLACCGRS